MLKKNSGLSEKQFEFRKGRCIDDATRALLIRVYEASHDRKTAIAVSLDIKNAFNIIGWQAYKNS